MATLTKDQKKYLTIGGVAAFGLVLLGVLGKKKKTHGVSFYLPGDTVETEQAGSFTMRVPRGSYLPVAEGNVKLIAADDTGVSTDLVFVVGSAPNPYTEQVLVFDENNQATQFGVTVIARKAAA